ncbi:MAG: helix-turn-helix domain-containing protein [Myxococcota bacterium]
MPASTQDGLAASLTGNGALGGPELAGWRALVFGGAVEAPHARLRDAIVRGQGARLRQRLAADLPLPTPWHVLSRDAALGWLAWIEGRAEDALAAGERLESEARAGGFAGWTIDGALLRALGETALSDGSRENAEGVRTARRAFRMARHESLPHWEMVGALVLARARRHAQTSVLAAWIARSASRFMPEAFDRWVRWELLLCGLPETGDEPFADARESEVRARLQAWGDAFGADGHATFAADAQAAYGLCFGDGEASAFTEGASNVAPRGLGGFAGAAGAQVLMRDGRARRLARGAAALLDLPPTEGKRIRVDAALSVLAFAGEAGLSPGAFFEAVYGFRYVEGRHGGTLRVLLHRLRAALPVGASLQTDGAYVLRAREPFLVTDPRTAQSEQAELLAVLSTTGSYTAKEIAGRLELPLRTIQDALRRLAEDGICQVRKVGRRNEYFLEDTTYADPTAVGAGST